MWTPETSIQRGILSLFYARHIFSFFMWEYFISDGFWVLSDFSGRCVWHVKAYVTYDDALLFFVEGEVDTDHFGC